MSWRWQIWRETISWWHWHVKPTTPIWQWPCRRASLLIYTVCGHRRSASTHQHRPLGPLGRLLCSAMFAQLITLPLFSFPPPLPPLPFPPYTLSETPRNSHHHAVAEHHQQSECHRACLSVHGLQIQLHPLDGAGKGQRERRDWALLGDRFRGRPHHHQLSFAGTFHWGQRQADSVQLLQSQHCRQFLHTRYMAHQHLL